MFFIIERILILITRGKANSVIFNQFIYADSFAKLLSVLKKQQLKVLPLPTRADYAPYLRRPMLEVLSMLLRVLRWPSLPVSSCTCIATCHFFPEMPWKVCSEMLRLSWNFFWIAAASYPSTPQPTNILPLYP